MAEKSYIRNLRKLTQDNPTPADIEALEKELYRSGSDRTSVVMFGTLVESFLERLLQKAVREDLNREDRKRLFDYEGAAGTFSAKILVAHAFKLIGPITRHDLNLIRLLRNEFAHSRVALNFGIPEVQEACRYFKIVDLPDAFLNDDYLIRVAHLEPAVARDINHPKTRFFAACNEIAIRMDKARGGSHAGDRTFTDGDPVP